MKLVYACSHQSPLPMAVQSPLLPAYGKAESSRLLSFTCPLLPFVGKTLAGAWLMLTSQAVQCMSRICRCSDSIQADVSLLNVESAILKARCDGCRLVPLLFRALGWLLGKLSLFPHIAGSADRGACWIYRSHPRGPPCVLCIAVEWHSLLLGLPCCDEACVHGFWPCAAADLQQ